MRAFTRPLGAAVAALLGLGLAAGPAATPGVAAPLDAAQPAAAAAGGVTIAIDPSYRHAPWQGWGTSLVWLAHATGGYPDEIRNKLVDLLFGKDGLNLNIARYNIGGGNAPTVTDYLRPGGAVPGFWKAPQPYGPNDKEWWDPENPEHWNWDADPNQRWWIDQIKKKVDHWEAFSNSPPYFQTVSGYVSGGFDANAEQIRADKVDDFAKYLVRVAEHIEKAHGIKFDTIDPLNEPNTDYWRTTLGANGQPTGGRQEGAHAGPALQAQVVEALQRALTGASTKAGISAPDETNPSKFLTDWYGYTPAAQEAVDQLNVHTYGTGQRTAARDVAKAEQRPLWMSEVEGSWGKDFTSMDSGLGMAQRVIDDIRELEPSAWVLWQPVEDAKNMIAEGNLQWGSIHVPFDCKATDTLKTCPIQTNTKFDTLRNFTHYIKPGDRVVKVDDVHSVAALTADGKGATLVHANPGTTAETVTLDLSKFGTVAGNATVTPVVTSAAGKLKRGSAIKVGNRKATVTVPAQSVTTFLITGVSAVAENAAHLQAGHTYRLEGVASGRSLAPAASGTSIAIRTNDPAATNQLWKLNPVGDAGGNRARYTLTNAGTGQQLAIRSGNVVLEAAGAVDEAAQWVVSTTGDGTYTFINVGNRRLLDVNGAAVTDGSAVGSWLPSSGGNQRWAVRDEDVASTEVVKVHTVPGRAPVLPPTVTAVLNSGAKRTLPVVWQVPPSWRWWFPNVVKVKGSVTDVFGRKTAATTEVTVDRFVSTEPGRAKTYPGGVPALPATVVALGKFGGRADLPVTWNPAPAGAFDRLGVVTLTGKARVVDGTALPATARVQITAPSDGIVSTEPGVTVSATFTENGYSTLGLTNGDTSDKAWSNWKGSDRNPAETLTLRLPRTEQVTRLRIHFYKDNQSGGGLAQSIRAGVPDAAGQCVAAGPEVAVGVDSPLAAAPGTAVCLQLTTVPNGYLTVAELEAYAKAPGQGSDATLNALKVDGATVPGFKPATTTYRVATRNPDKAVVTATATDPYATVSVTRQGRVWTVKTVGEDGTKKLTYRVELVKR
jgi:O-glycosyl hydrolase